LESDDPNPEPSFCGVTEAAIVLANGNAVEAGRFAVTYTQSDKI